MNYGMRLGQRPQACEESRVRVRNGRIKELTADEAGKSLEGSGKAHKKIENTGWSSSQLLQDGTVTTNWPKETRGDFC